MLVDEVGLQSNSYLALVQNIAFVSLGAFIGVSFRFTLIHYFRSITSPIDWSITFINLIASFLFGISLALELKYSSYPEQISLFFNVGFLGSFSTFSTYILEIFDKLQKQNIRHFFKLCTIPLIGSILLLSIGYLIGNI